MDWHLVKVIKNSNQRFDFNIGGNVYSLILLYNSYDNTWKLNILKNNLYLISGLTVTVGYDNVSEYNILEQFQYLNIGKLYFYTENSETPTASTIKELIINWVY